MKLKISTVLILLAAAVMVRAYSLNTYEFTFAAGDTNSITIDVGNTSQVGLNIYFSGLAGSAGNLTLSCSNSFDGQNWKTDAVHSITFPLASITSSNFAVNFSGLDSSRFWKYTIVNSSSEAIPYFRFTAGHNDGL